MFIFDRCCRSSAAATPVKYECDANKLTGTFARSKILLTEKLTNGALVTPIPGVGVTKAPFVNFSASRISHLAKVPVRFFESHSYLTGVTATELRRHLSNLTHWGRVTQCDKRDIRWLTCVLAMLQNSENKGKLVTPPQASDNEKEICIMDTYHNELLTWFSDEIYFNWDYQYQWVWTSDNVGVS